MNVKSKEFLSFIKIFVGCVVGVLVVSWVFDNFVWKENDWNLYHELFVGAFAGLGVAINTIRIERKSKKQSSS